MNELMVMERDGKFVVNSRDVAEMIDKDHAHLLRDIKGYVEILGKSKFGLAEFFTESSYEDIQGKLRLCYLLTKKGCDIVANKMTGEKGILFTAAYVSRFDEMEKQIKTQQLSLPSTYVEALKALVASEEEKERMKPKADYCDKVLLPSNLKTTTDIAKDLGMSAQKLNKILHALEIIYKRGDTWYLYADYEHLVPEYCDYHINEYGQLLKWTEKGRQFIIEQINK